MPKQVFEVERDGQVFEVTVEEGEDPNEVLNEVLGVSAPAAEEGTLGDELTRQVQGARRGSRIVAAPFKLATGIADIGASALNLIPAGLSKAQEAIGGKPITARLPTDSTAQLDALLDQIFGAPQGFTERVALEGAELALPGVGITGGLAKAAAPATRVAKKTGEVLKPAVTRGPKPRAAKTVTPEGGTKLADPRGVVTRVGDDIAEFALRSPKTATAVELTGAGGVSLAGALGEEAELGPVAQSFVELGGGVVGGFTPQTLISLSRRGATHLANFGTRAGAERRAAIRVQEVTGDPKAAARAAEEAPEGVLPARAADDSGLKTLESKMLADNPALADQVEANLRRVEEQSLNELAGQFGPGTTSQQWQQRVVQEVAPDGVQITQRQADEMIDDAFRGFGRAYDDVRGHSVEVNVPLNGQGQPIMPRGLLDAVLDPAVLTGPEVRRRVGAWLQGRYAAVVTTARRTGRGAADNPVFEVTSDQLLELRHVIRRQQRQKAKQVGSADSLAEAELLANADRGLTQVLNRALPDDGGSVLRALDAKYASFVTVEEAARRGAKGLTGDSLRGALKSRSSVGQFARGETGRLGELAEQAANVRRILATNDVEAAEKMVRTMNPAELQAAKGDFSTALQAAATRRIDRADTLDGKLLLTHIDNNRAVLGAAGFNSDEIANMERVARTIQLVQNKSARAVTELISDDVGTVMRLLAAIAGSRAGTRILKLFGGSTGAGPSLILAQFGSKTLRERLGSLTKDKADELLRAALAGARTEDGQSVLAALLTKPTAPIDKQAAAARTVNAWLIEVGVENPEATGEE